MSRFVSDIAFTSAVKSQQEKRGSRAAYERMALKHDWQNTVTPDLASFLADRDSFYLATANGDGHPYIQHRGGPKGLLRILDSETLAFADFAGNKQYISLGNLAENDKAFIFLMDYANRLRVKIWGHAQVIEEDHDLLSRLADPAYGGKPERAIRFAIEAWDVNCPQHIHRRYDEATVEIAMRKLTERVVELEAEVARLKGQ